MSKETRRILFQIALFLLTFFSTTVAGNELAYGRNIFFTPDYGWQDFVNGFSFSVPLLLILTVHEFGHYFVAIYHKVKTSLPYYIPIPPIPFLPSLGTMGAVIRMRSRPYSNIQSFDIGLAGPLAGFIAAVIIMIYGFATLPPPEYVFQFHPEYEKYGLNYADSVYTEKFRLSEANKRLREYKKEDSIRVQKAIANNQPVEKRREVTEQDFLSLDFKIGNTLAFTVLGKLFADQDRLPNPHEIMHYPIMLACAIALLFTSLNLFPIGQLDGGHVVYGLFGFRTHKIIATVCFVGLLFYSGLGLPILNLVRPDSWSIIWVGGYVAFLFLALKSLQLPVKDTWMYALLLAAIQVLLLFFFPTLQGYQGWLLFVFIIGRLAGVQHPRSEVELPLDSRRIILGWITLLIFILCFSPSPIG